MKLRTLIHTSLSAAALLLLSSGADARPAGPYQFYWGAFGPSEPSVDRSTIPNITEGRTIVLYEPWAGMFPKYWEGQEFYGVVPQRADMAAHLAKLEADIIRQIPDPNFNGYVCIDYEAWDVLWSHTGEEYKELSRQIVRATYTGLTDAQVEAQAKTDFETAGRSFYLQTLEKAKQVRPLAKWGFYHFPTIEHLDHLAEIQNIFDASTVLFPVAYTVSPAATGPNPAPGEITSAYYPSYIQRDVGQARVIAGDRPVIAFVWCRYHDMNPIFGGQFLRDNDLLRMFREPRLAGADATLIWEYVETPTMAAEYNDYFVNHLAPVINQVNNEFNPAPVPPAPPGQGQANGGSGGTSAPTNPYVPPVQQPAPPPPASGGGNPSYADAGDGGGSSGSGSSSNASSSGGSSSTAAPADPAQPGTDPNATSGNNAGTSTKIMDKKKKSEKKPKVSKTPKVADASTRARVNSFAKVKTPTKVATADRDLIAHDTLMPGGN